MTTTANVTAGRRLHDVGLPPAMAELAEATADRLDTHAQGRVPFLAVAGSHAYGTAHADSDLDVRGFYVAPNRTLLGLGRPTEQYDLSEPADAVVFEVGKFLHLALAGNPNALEVLFGPALRADDAVGPLLALRDEALSRQLHVSYGGYATSQLRRVRERRAGELARRRTKHLLHCFRLLEQGTAALTDGTLQLRVSDVGRLRELAESDDDRVEAEFATRLAVLDAAAERSRLPERPDRDLFDAALVELRHTLG